MHIPSVPVAARRLSRRRMLAFALLIGVGLAATPLAARAIAAFAPAHRAAAPVQDVQDFDEPDTRIIPANTDLIFPLIVNPYGISFDELTFQAGAHHLLVRNATGNVDADLTFSVRSTDGRATPHTLTLRAGEDKFFDLTLDPGEYEVTETSHPDHVFHVHVVP